MAISNSKNSGVLLLSNYLMLSFFHNTIPSDAGAYDFYLDESKNQKVYSLDISSYKQKYRCLQYQAFYANSVQPLACPFVLYKGTGGNSVNVLYQTNFANVQSFNDLYMCTFWSTLSYGKTCQLTGTSGTSYYIYGAMTQSSTQTKYLKYDPSKILKIDMKNLDSFQLDDSCNNIFCSCNLTIKTLYVSGDKFTGYQPVVTVQNLPIVLQQVKSTTPVLDISLDTGSSGGGMIQHTHIPHVDGTSFAFAVFHPGTGMPQLPWS